MYHSSAERNSGARSKKKKRDEPSQFAKDTFAAFEPFINVFDCGIEYLDSPIHLITKEDWKLYAEHKAGEIPTFEDGTRFNPYLDVVRNIFGPEHVQKHIENNEVTYYTSGRSGFGLLYLDIDAHHPWQTDEAKGRELLQRLFPFGYFRPSGRGQNGYLKVNYVSVSEFNELADDLEHTLKRLFLHCGILCDIEVKGTITHNGKSGKLAKLPFTNKRKMRDDSDGWGLDHLERFMACPVVNSKRIAYKAQLVEDRIDGDRVARCLERKESLEEREKATNKLIGQLRDFGWNGSDRDILKRLKQLIEEQHATLGTVKIPVFKRVAQDQRVSHTSGVAKKLAASMKRVEPAKESGRCEGNAFTRNQHDLLPFVREFYKRHHRFPDVEDALIHLRDNGLFSGQWEDNQDRRATRVGQILGFIETTFDPKLLTSGDSHPLDLRLGIFSWWVRQKFGFGIRYRTVDVRRFDPVSMSAPLTEIVVPARFIETFLAVAEFCLNIDPLDNQAVPTNRFRKLWKMVEGGAPWNQRYFQIVRDTLDQAGVIRIFDRDHETGKAWRWTAGPNFPEGTWKEEQRRLKERCKPLRGPALSFEELAASSKLVFNNRQHNPLYQIDCGILKISAPKQTCRPPPDW